MKRVTSRNAGSIPSLPCGAYLRWACCFLSLASAVSCVQFAGNSSVASRPTTAPLFCQLPSFELEFLNFHLRDWPDARQTIEETLQIRYPVHSDQSIPEGRKPRLRIILESFPVGKHHSEFLEGDPLAFTGRRLSQVAFRWTFGLIPIYEPRKRSFIYEVWASDTLTRSFRYESEYHVLVGLPALLAAPFVSRKDIHLDAKQNTRLFLHDYCQSGRAEAGLSTIGRAEGR